MIASTILNITGRIFYGIIDASFIFFTHLSKYMQLTWGTFKRTPLLLKNINLTTHQMYILGIESLPLVAIASVFVGGETVIQASFIFQGMIPMRYLGFAVSKTLVTELGPVLTSFVVCSRVSTAIAAEIGSMKTTEQLDAMSCLSLDSIRYLIVPKVIACIIMLPVLVIFSELLAFIGSVITAVLFVKVPFHVYINGLKMFFSLSDMLMGILKTTVFGAIIALTGAHFGFQARKGAQGVGEATTRAVMTADVLILFFDFLIAFLFL